MKIFIVGSVGSGKTTFAKSLAIKYDLLHYEVDCIVWKKTKDSRVRRNYEEQIKYINEIDNTSSWIIEGTYRESCDLVMQMADKIIFLDTPLYIRLYRIILRFIKQQLKIEHSHYKSDWKMLFFMFKWAIEFNDEKRNLMNKLDKNKLLIIKSTKNFSLYC